MAERSAQVLAISGIYRRAKKVVVWLEESNGSVERLLRFLAFTEGCVQVSKLGGMEASKELPLNAALDL